LPHRAAERVTSAGCPADALGFDLQTVHLPHIRLAAVVAPENIAHPIAVVISDRLGMPIAGDGGVRGGTFRFDAQAVHLPNVDLPIVMARTQTTCQRLVFGRQLLLPGGEPDSRLVLEFAPSVFDRDVSSFNVAGLGQSLAEGGQKGRFVG
jgi:hypothetical protein